MLDDFIRKFVGLVILVMLASWFVSLLIQALAQLFHGLFAVFGWAAQALLLLGFIAFAVGVAVRAGRVLARMWRRGVGEESRHVSVRRRAEVEERRQPQVPPQDEADPPLMEEE